MSTKTLALFFTRGISLKIWKETGLFEREKLLYHAHLECGDLHQVHWMTYGALDEQIAKDLKSQGQLHRSVVLCQMPKFFNFFLGSWLYSFVLPLVHYKALRKSQVFKTNQIDGSWTAVLAKWLYNKPLIVRTGFTQSIFFKKAGKNMLVLFLSQAVERFAYKFANSAVVASRSDQQYIMDQYQLNTDKVNVIHNYIDTKVFKPVESEKFKDRVVFVGRLNQQKNLFNLIDAISQTNLNLDVYGQGDLKDSLESHAQKKEVKVSFKGVVNNNELPTILNHYHYYILPSKYEGMPKTLLEAMACSLVCIGTDVKGINEVIEDGVSGFLAKTTDTADIVDAITRAINYSNPNTISQNARLLIGENFSLDSFQKKEISIVNDLVGTHD